MFKQYVGYNVCRCAHYVHYSWVISSHNTHTSQHTVSDKHIQMVSSKLTLVQSKIEIAYYCIHIYILST